MGRSKKAFDGDTCLVDRVHTDSHGFKSHGSKKLWAVLLPKNHGGRGLVAVHYEDGIPEIPQNRPTVPKTEQTLTAGSDSQ